MEGSRRQLFRYLQIAQELQERVRSGRYPTGRLPAERTLGEEFGVQRDTIRRALQTLTDDGVLLRDSTRGTRIAPRTSVPVNREGSVLLVVRTFEDTTAPAAVFRGLSQRLGEVGIPVYWCDPGDTVPGNTAVDLLGDHSQLPPPDRLAARGIRGVVTWPQLPGALAELRLLRNAALPLVLIDRRVPGFETDFVGFRDAEGGRTVTEHLIRLGHRRIGFISGEPQASAVQARLAGYIAAQREADLPYDPSLILHQEGGSRLLVPAMVDAFLRGRDGNPVTAVVCANDIVAARLIHLVRSTGRQVPGDVAVTGFGDLLPSMLDAFGITTIAQPFDAMGRTAADLLLSRLDGNGEDREAEVREVELPMRLIVRESCGSRSALRLALK